MAKQIKKYSKIALIIALSITMSVIFLQIPQAQSAALTDRELRLDDSRVSDVAFYGASTTADYDFLATSTSATNISCIRVWFCTSASNPAWDGSGCTGPTGMNFGDVDKGNSAAWNDLTYANWSIIASSTNYITASTTVAEQLNDAGDGGSWVFGNVYNPSATGTYYAWIYTHNDVDCTSLSQGGVVDNGLSAFAVFQGVTVTATVVEDLSVTINASSCSSYLQDSAQSIASATTSIGYGNIVAEDFYDSCQGIDIGTNAANGYIARIHKTQQLTSGGLDVISDGNCDSSCTISASEDWGTDTNNGFGYCMQDKTLNGAGVADSEWDTVYCGPSGTQQFKLISNSTSTAESIMQSNSATSTNSAWIAYRLSVDSAQAAGTYSTEIIYTVTPKF